MHEHIGRQNDNIGEQSPCISVETTTKISWPIIFFARVDRGLPGTEWLKRRDGIWQYGQKLLSNTPAQRVVVSDKKRRF